MLSAFYVCCIYRGDNLRHNIDLVDTLSGAIFGLQGKLFPS